MNSSLKSLFRDAVRVAGFRPRQLFFLLKVLRHQYRAIGRRMSLEKQGTHVPPFLIVSVTSQCNLKCQGCYDKMRKHDPSKQLSSERLDALLTEAEELGISVVLLAGGEPLLRQDLFTVTKKHSRIVFPVFTNGMYLQGNMLETFVRQPQLIPVISIEGNAERTDRRRGSGVYAQFLKTTDTLQRRGMFFGISITLTSANFDECTDMQFLASIVATGCKLIFFIEYIPVQEKSENLVLTKEQKNKLPEIMKTLRATFSALFIDFPGDEEKFGGCLAAGRGFVHISAEGSVEPCPFSPYSDAAVTSGSLKEALRSKFLQTIRDNHHRLTETQSGCALWENQDWVKSIL